MSSIIRTLLTGTFAVITVATIPSSLAFADDPVGVEHDRPVAGRTVGVAGLAKPATEIVRGTVASIDEGRDTIKIQRSPDTTEELNVQDGLLFSAVRYGDLVEVTVEDINGAKTIVRLKKE
jgi:hypothetical protein